MSQDGVDQYTVYLRGISFVFLQPHTPIPRGVGFRRITKTIRKLTGWSLEHQITRLPDPAERNTADLLYNLCKIPKMSTLAIGAAINYGVYLMPPEQDYVNIGVWNGFSFLAGLIANEDKTCIGIDNFSQFGGPEAEFRKRYEALKTPKSRFCNMDYQEFLNGYQGTMGIYFYDGGHSYEDQLKGLQLAEPFFSDDCIVIVDDTNWKEPREATEEFIRKSQYSYEMLLNVRTRYPYHPTFWNGIMIFRRKNKAN